MPIDYDFTADLFRSAFDRASTAFLSGSTIGSLAPEIVDPLDKLFSSKTQTFREALSGCLLARINDKTINIRKPYASQGSDAFNGRTLDEKVVNPILQQRRIPSSRGPFLSVFRRSVGFTNSTRNGIRDKSAYDDFLRLLEYTERIADNNVLIRLLDSIAYRFIELREASEIPLTRIQRMSLSQVSDLVYQLLETPSGGRFPMYLIVAAFQAIDKHFDLHWDIRWQGINVADSASGTGGDIVVSSGGKTLIVAEVTERLVDRNRVVATFNNKIGPNPMEDYLFFVSSNEQPSDAVQQNSAIFRTRTRNQLYRNQKLDSSCVGNNRTRGPFSLHQPAACSLGIPRYAGCTEGNLERCCRPDCQQSMIVSTGYITLQPSLEGIRAVVSRSVLRHGWRSQGRKARWAEQRWTTPVHPQAGRCGHPAGRAEQSELFLRQLEVNSLW